MSILFITIFVIAGLIFSGSVLLMNPKGGLGLGIGGTIGGGSNEYGSKKSVESSLKMVAQRSGIVLIVLALILPYILK